MWYAITPPPTHISSFHTCSGGWPAVPGSAVHHHDPEGQHLQSWRLEQLYHVCRNTDGEADRLLGAKGCRHCLPVERLSRRRTSLQSVRSLSLSTPTHRTLSSTFTFHQSPTKPSGSLGKKLVLDVASPFAVHPSVCCRKSASDKASLLHLPSRLNFSRVKGSAKAPCLHPLPSSSDPPALLAAPCRRTTP